MENKFINAAFVAAAVATGVAAYESDYDVSREGKVYRGLVVVNTEGVSTPARGFELVESPEQEPKAFQNLTPLGQRQQFLIGSELRKRYVEEAKVLAENYVVSELSMQTPFFGKHILSMQAQMMGLYPASDANDLTEWQQGNAVPPVEGADFSEWQQELGAHALPHGLNIFPIEQTGLEADYLLSVNEQNCPLFKKVFYSTAMDLDYIALQGLPYKWSDFVKQRGSTMHEFCEYLEWAWLTSTPLKDQVNMDNLRRDNCHTYNTQYVNALRQFEEENSNLVASEFVEELKEKIAHAAGIQNWSETKRFSRMKKRLQAEHSNADPLPNVYHAYTAFTPDHLYLFAFATLDRNDLDRATYGVRVLPNASTLIFEVDSSNNVHAYLNDRQVTPAGCQPRADCPASVFVNELSKKITFTDIAEACQQ